LWTCLRLLLLLLLMMPLPLPPLFLVWMVSWGLSRRQEYLAAGGVPLVCGTLH
jgi:hypothetical protein